MRKVFVAFIFGTILFTSYSFAEKADAIYGYVKGEYFHPMVSIKNNEIMLASRVDIDTPAKIKPIFKDDSNDQNTKVISLSSPENYKNVLGVEGGGTRAKLIQTHGEDTSSFLFFQSINNQSIKFYNDESINISFYHYFSKDNWGQHFINKALLVKSSKDIGKETDVNIHGLTDLDSDGKKEVWVSYKLRYGEIGVMLYEQSNDNNWELLLNHCYWCD